MHPLSGTSLMNPMMLMLHSEYKGWQSSVVIDLKIENGGIRHAWCSAT